MTSGSDIVLYRVQWDIDVISSSHRTSTPWDAARKLVCNRVPPRIQMININRRLSLIVYVGTYGARVYYRKTNG